MSTTSNEYRITSGPFASLWKVFIGLGVVGLGASFTAMGSDTQRFTYSYLFAFAVVLTIALGATFFVLFQHFTNASWSVSVRRIAEVFMAALPVLALLFLPVALNAQQVFPWWGDHHAPTAQHAPASASSHTNSVESPEGEGPSQHHGSNVLSQEQIEHHAHAEVLEAKAWYLNIPFFTGRAIFYFLVWSLLSWRFFKNSTTQDSTRSTTETAKSQALTPVATLLFGLTTTFAAFDWFMSLLPGWYSTIFGVVFFASSVVGGLSAITLVAYGLRAAGITGDAINTEHFHDLGKLLFGFVIFWAYVSFAQFFLIWYASIPEETTFFHIRWGNGPWMNVSLAILFLHFVVPFFLLLSRNTKRLAGQKALVAGALLLLVMHIVEMYWLVLPNMAVVRGISAGSSAALSLHWLDFTCLLGVGGIYLAVVFYFLASHPTVPIGDPRLGRSLHFENA